MRAQEIIIDALNTTEVAVRYYKALNESQGNPEFVVERANAKKRFFELARPDLDILMGVLEEIHNEQQEVIAEAIAKRMKS